MADTYTEKRTIPQAKADEVFAYVADIDNFPEWADAVVEARADRDLEVGVDIHSLSSMMGLKINGRQTVVAHDPPAHFAYGGDDPFPTRFDWTFAQDGDDVRLELRCEISPRGLPGGGLVVGRFIKRQISGMASNVAKAFGG